ncbi:MAG TPA: phosphoenolpyruvate carboxylase [Steroidobacteraceae bacterium]|nr:phosphoenolpyruvate carboxylase [Steroidobacteraceae bacterium]
MCQPDAVLRRSPRRGTFADPFATYSEETNAELMVFRTAAQIHAVYGRSAIPSCIISKAEEVSDLLEVARGIDGFNLLSMET